MRERIEMKIKKYVMIIFLLFLTVEWNTAQAIEPDKGIIEGTMINKTTGKPVPDQKIVIYKYLNQKDAGNESSKTDENGKFRFENLSTGQDYSYSLYSKYHEAEYWSKTIIFNGAATVKNFQFSVYDATSSARNISVKMHHIIFDIQGKLLLVREVLIFYNSGERTYIGKKEEGRTRKITLKFSLPKGFANPKYPQGEGLMVCCVIPTEQGLLDTMSVKPGQRQVVFTYRLKYNSSKYLFRRLLDYDTEHLSILFPEGKVKVVSQGIPFSSTTVKLNGKSYLYLQTKGEIKAGTLLNLKLSDLPADNGYLRIIIYSLVVILILLGFAYPLFRKKKTAKDKKEVIKDNKEALLSAIAQLDDRFHAGEISEMNYRTLRRQKKEKLMELYKEGKNTENE